MPYRALTHGRVRGAQPAPENAHNNQVKAIQSQKGVGNSGPIRKNNSNPRQSKVRTLSRNFLMAKNAYGSATFTAGDGKQYSNYSPGQGKGFPEATPLPSVGSVNRFARRAIARRAVTRRISDPLSINCCEHKIQSVNLVQSFTIAQAIALQNLTTIPSFFGANAMSDPYASGANVIDYNPSTVIGSGDHNVIFWGPAYAPNSSLGSVSDWGSANYGDNANGSFFTISYDDSEPGYQFAIQIGRPVGLRSSAIGREKSYVKDFMVKLTVTRSASTLEHDAGDVQVILNHKVKATQMQSGAASSQNRASLLFCNDTVSTNLLAFPGNADNGSFEGTVNLNYSDIDFTDPNKMLQLNDRLTLSITEA